MYVQCDLKFTFKYIQFFRGKKSLQWQLNYRPCRFRNLVLFCSPIPHGGCNLLLGLTKALVRKKCSFVVHVIEKEDFFEQFSTKFLCQITVTPWPNLDNLLTVGALWILSYFSSFQFKNSVVPRLKSTIKIHKEWEWWFTTEQLARISNVARKVEVQKSGKKY